MATATFAEASTQLKNGIKPFTDLEAAAGTIVTSIDAAEQDLEGDTLPAAVISVTAELRARLSSAMDWTEARRLWDAWAIEVLRIAGLPLDDVWARIHRYMFDNSQDFNARGWTRGAMTAGGSNVGSGEGKRLTVDWEGMELQGGAVEVKTFYCDRDQNTGRRKGAEEFVCRGEDRSKDNLDWQGSGVVVRPVCARHAGSGPGGSLLQNPSFDSSFGSESTTKIPGWVITTGTTTNITAGTSGFATEPGASAQGTLVFAAQAGVLEVTQALSVRLLNMRNERTPMMLSVCYKKSAAGSTGTLNLKLGSKTTSLDLSTIGDTNWHVLYFTIDKNLYYRNWREDAPDVEIEVDTGAGGTVTFDRCVLTEWDYIDGSWFWIHGGATAFLERDVFTATDTGPTAAGSELMYSAYRVGIFRDAIINLPVDAVGGESITDP